jgi:hypothetical protein
MIRTHVVRNSDDLDRVVLAGPALTPGRSIRLELAGLDPQERARWQSRLGRAYGVCGCITSAGFATVALLGYPALALTVSLLRERSLWTRVLLGVAIVVGAAVVGKVIGLAVGQAWLRLTVAAFRRHLARG